MNVEVSNVIVIRQILHDTKRNDNNWRTLTFQFTRQYLKPLETTNCADTLQIMKNTQQNTHTLISTIICWGV